MWYNKHFIIFVIFVVVDETISGKVFHNATPRNGLWTGWPCHLGTLATLPLDPR